MKFAFEGWEETLERVSFVEILVRLDLDDEPAPADLISAGRRAGDR
jgi:hypothetical protein